MSSGNGFSLALGKYQKRVDARMKLVQNKNFVDRLWTKDSSLFRIKDKTALPMGWLDLPGKMLEALPSVNDFCKEIRHAGFENVVLLGMGGSSLAPLVFRDTFGLLKNGLNLMVLDTTEPETVKKVENSININKTLFIVSSKSGSTAEVSAFYEYFYYRVAAGKREHAGENFIAITDEGSPLADLAVKKKFRRTFINFSDVGGRFSALSYFGIVPAALAGVNVKEILLRAKDMAELCRPGTALNENPGVMLGIAVAELTLRGCDKLTYLMPKHLESFGLWMEQLVAESTGKQGKGVMPFSGSPLCGASCYGKDRFFVKTGFLNDQNDAQPVFAAELEALKYPMINIFMKDELDLGKEFFRWEIATATIGAILGINPFDQPNVQESKKFTGVLLEKVEKDGKLPRMEPSLCDESVIYYAGEKKENGKDLMEDLMKDIKLEYVAFQAYLPEETEVNKALSDMQMTIQKNLKVPASVQYGPRYLHSTGQYHKGGPNTGFFIQFVSNSAVDIHIPGHKFTFGMLKRAQAIGDREALLKHKRKVVLIDLGDDYIAGLNTVKRIIDTLQPRQLSQPKSAAQPKVKRKNTYSASDNTIPQAIVLLNTPGVNPGGKE